VANVIRLSQAMCIAVFTLLAEKGISTYSYDMCSFGKSEEDDRERGKVARFRDLVDDLVAFYKQLEAQGTHQLSFALSIKTVRFCMSDYRCSIT
jgi:hypothetical protein